MSTKTYRLKVKKIPLLDEIEYKRPNFPQFRELHLDLLENKTKLKKNPPKPIFVYDYHLQGVSDKKCDHDTVHDNDDDFTLEELEKAYANNSDSDDVFSDHDDHKSEPGTPDRGHKPNKEYRQEEFEQEAEEEEDEEERERREKADLLFSFMVLRRKYKNVEIPEFTEHSDITTMRRVYEQIIRRVSLDSSVDNYKQYLVGGFMVLEWVSTNWMGIDLSGFTQQQIKMMNRYERLLIELGEKNYSTMGSRFPVEVRLIFFVIFNAGLFYVQKMIFAGGGGGTDILNTLFGGPVDTQQAQPAPRRRRQAMRGPTITPHEVEELNNNVRGSEDEQSSTAEVAG